MTSVLEQPTMGARQQTATVAGDASAALRFITCGSVDDGKSTLIGRLLVDSKAVLQDQLAGVTRAGEADLALLTDGLSAEREQGITIDVAYRYFATPQRKFIIGDAPGHEQYTRNMVTAASCADAAVVLVDATKLDWSNPQLVLLPQTRRHALLVHLLRVPAVVFAVNKLDAVDHPAQAFGHIAQALARFAAEAGMQVHATLPISALKGHNVVDARAGWCGYDGPSLLQLLEQLPTTTAPADTALALPVQWVEKFSASADTSQGRRIFWGRVAAGRVAPGDTVRVHPGGQSAVVAQVLDHARRPAPAGAGESTGRSAGHSAGIVLDREVDVSRGDWLLAQADSASHIQGQREVRATVAWLDDEPLVAGRAYWALHGHRWVKARVARIEHQLDIHTLQTSHAQQIPTNGIGRVVLQFQEPLPVLAYAASRTLGALVLVDTATHKTAGAVLVNENS